MFKLILCLHYFRLHWEDPPCDFRPILASLEKPVLLYHKIATGFNHKTMKIQTNPFSESSSGSIK